MFMADKKKKIHQDQVMNEIRTLDTKHSHHRTSHFVDKRYPDKKQPQYEIYQRENCGMYIPLDPMVDATGKEVPHTKYGDIKINSQSWKYLDYILYGLFLKRGMSRKEIEEKRWIRKNLDEWCNTFGFQKRAENISNIEVIFMSLKTPLILTKRETIKRDEKGEVVYKKNKKGKATNEFEKETPKKIYFNIIDDIVIGTNYIEIALGYRFLQFLADSSYWQRYREEMFSIDTNRNPCSYNLAYKLQFHGERNKGKSNENIISVENLTAVCDVLPDLKKATEEEERSRRKETPLCHSNKFIEKVVKPFERDMNALVDKNIISEWYYIQDKVRYCGKVNLKNFYSLNIYFKLAD